VTGNLQINKVIKGHGWKGEIFGHTAFLGKQKGSAHEQRFSCERKQHKTKKKRRQLFLPVSQADFYSTLTYGDDEKKELEEEKSSGPPPDDCGGRNRDDLIRVERRAEDENYSTRNPLKTKWGGSLGPVRLQERGAARPSGLRTQGELSRGCAQNRKKKGKGKEQNEERRI